MVNEVKDLIKEGYAEEKILANLVKIGFSETEAKEILSEAKGTTEAKTTNFPIEEALSNEDDLLLAAEKELKPPQQFTAPPKPKPPQPKTYTPKPSPETSNDGQKKAFLIFGIAFAIILILAYFILLPKLGV